MANSKTSHLIANQSKSMDCFLYDNAAMDWFLYDEAAMDLFLYDRRATFLAFDYLVYMLTFFSKDSLDCAMTCF